MTTKLIETESVSPTTFGCDWRDLPHYETIQIAQESYQIYRQFISQKLGDTPGVLEVRMKRWVLRDWPWFLCSIDGCWDFDALIEKAGEEVREDLPIVIGALDWFIAFDGDDRRVHVRYHDALARFRTFSSALDRYWKLKALPDQDLGSN